MRFAPLFALAASCALAAASMAVSANTTALVDQDGWLDLEGVGLHPDSPTYVHAARGWPEQSLERRGHSGKAKITWCAARDHPTS